MEQDQISFLPFWGKDHTIKLWDQTPAKFKLDQ